MKPDSSPGKTLRLLNVAGVLIALAGIAAQAGESAPKPNVVFILMDDLRWDALGCTGSSIAKTPNIDRIAREGARFKNFFVSIPLCSPSRGSFLTGQYAHTHGVTNNADHTALSHRLVTFPRLLHDAGYETAYVGKWHMGGDDSPRPGFDRWVSFKGQGVYADPMINVDGKATKMTGYMTDILNQHAVDFVKAPHTNPFLLYLAHKAVHGPFTPAARHAVLYADANVPPAPNHGDTLAGKPALTRELPQTTNAAAPPAKRKKAARQETRSATNSAPGRHNIMRNQFRSLAAVDEGVGQLFQALEETKQLDNTMILFTSDNGFFWGEHGLSDKRWAYEESIRDPLLIRFPKLIKPGTVLEPFALNIDVAPTLLDLASAPVPKTIQGRSLLPLFRNSKAAWRASFLTEYFQEPNFPRTPTWQAVRTERWKYMRYSGLDGMDELYDLQADPCEMKNRIGDPAAASALHELKAELTALLARNAWK